MDHPRKLRTTRLALAILAMVVASACSESPEQAPIGEPTNEPTAVLFNLLTPDQSGIAFQNDLQEDENINILTYPYLYNGGGVAVGDINNDGLPDIYFTANMRPNALYLNQGDMKFKEIAREAGVGGVRGWTTGVTMVDINADGWLDIYVCRSGNVPHNTRSNALFVNNGDLTFTDRAAEYGLDDAGYSTQASFFDYDRDGDLDMFLINHPIVAQQGFFVGEMKTRRDSLAGDKLYRNDDGHFVEVGEAAGIKSNPIGYGLGIAVSDVNGDQWPDVYVCNDYFEQDYLYINQGNGTFSNQLDSRIAHCSHFSMGVDVADYNNDGHTDIFTLDMLPEDNRRQKLLKGPSNYDRYEMQVEAGYHHQCMRNNLQLNQGYGTFSEVGQLAGISNTDWSWAPLVADFDLDGNKDLYVTNGYLRDYTNLDFIKYSFQEERDKALKAGKKPSARDIISRIPSTRLVNYAFKNTGELQFENKSADWGITQPSMSNGAAYADLDRDGDLDLVVNNINEPAFIYQNTSADGGAKSLVVELKGEGQNSFGIGAKVKVIATDGRQDLQEMYMSRGYQSSVEPRLVFGLGKGENEVAVEVTWPDGRVETVDHAPNGELLVLNQSNAQQSEPAQLKTEALFTSVESREFSFLHRENNFVDFKRDPLLPHMLSTQGPKLTTGDVNGDGRVDLIVGGAAGQPSELFVQTANSWFTRKPQAAWKTDQAYEDVGLALFDADGDGDLDLYAVSGGTAQPAGSPLLGDRLYTNDGKGNFSRDHAALSTTGFSGSCVRAADYDGDGDNDLFVGTRVDPGLYPRSSNSFLLENEGGKFKNVTAEKAPALLKAGMITDASWADVTGDGQPDLILAGEWRAIQVLTNKGGQLGPASGNGLEASTGWWNNVTAIDLDADGDLDLVGGNLGWNTQMRASAQEPVTMDAADFDGNGKIDPILSYYIQGKSYPVPTRDELLDQLNHLKRKFLRYADYADAGVSDIFESEKLKSALHLEVAELSTSIHINDGSGNFTAKALPVEAQFSTVFGVLPGDWNSDGTVDLLLAGNFYSVRSETGRYDASNGCLLLGTGSNNYKSVPGNESGFHASGDVRDLAAIPLANGGKCIVVARNNQNLELVIWSSKSEQ